ncbi:hypothetical protein ElyMa_003169000 [Elysia marginata]|uniref:Gustatory receptor n=1 Tax=Elysia marginata TaxID=1093978 RepID=A0AAV4J1U4_9GAST|nr:hypothetical protein ElyMa_003169000 [Elysia marginata]
MTQADTDHTDYQNVQIPGRRCSQVFSTPVTSKDFNAGIKINNGWTPLATPYDDKVSPGLIRLRMTPGVLREKQQRLITQHEEIRQKGDKLLAGGGVSLWPQMLQMRLTQQEVIALAVQAIVLSVISMWMLHKLHGETFGKLQALTVQAETFAKDHPISETLNQTEFHGQITNWHKDFLQLTNSVLEQFRMRKMSAWCKLYSLTYGAGLVTLVYYLLDNMLALNKLTPARIKKWTCLLSVIGTWTLIMSYGLVLAYQLEAILTGCVQRYSAALAELVVSPLDLTSYQAILLYWRSRLLDDVSPGVVSVLGVVPVRHVVHYIQFYSVPIVTVIVIPVVKLCCACIAVYGKGQYVKSSL